LVVDGEVTPTLCGKEDLTWDQDAEPAKAAPPLCGKEELTLNQDAEPAKATPVLSVEEAVMLPAEGEVAPVPCSKEDLPVHQEADPAKASAEPVAGQLEADSIGPSAEAATKLVEDPELLSRDRDGALDRHREAERANDELQEKIAEVQRALRRKARAKKAGKERASRADAQLAEERQKGERTREECNKLSQNMASALQSAQQASGECSEIEKRLTMAERLLKDRQAAAALEGADRFSKLQAQLLEERRQTEELESTRAGLDANNKSLEEKLREVAAMQAELQEELRRKEMDLQLHEAIPADFAAQRIACSPERSPSEVTRPSSRASALGHRGRSDAELVPPKAKPSSCFGKQLDVTPRGKLLRSRSASSPKKPRSVRHTPTRTPQRPGTADGMKVGTEAKVAALDRAIRGREDLQEVATKLRKPHASGSTSELAIVTSSLTVKNVDYNQLSASPALLGRFEQAMKKAIASAAGTNVAPEHVDLSLSAGSVVVLATITPPRGVSTASVHSKLESAPLGRTLASTVESVDGIRDVATGPITVSEVRVSSPVNSPPRTAHKATKAPLDSRTQREKDARKARRSLEDAIVLASRIQLLRAEGARTRKRITQAQQKAQVLSSTRAFSATATTKQFYTASAGYAPSGGAPLEPVAINSAAETAKPQGRWLAGAPESGATDAAAQLLQAVGCEVSEMTSSTLAESVELSFSLVVRKKLAASKENMQNLNAALKAEVAQLKGSFRGLLQQASPTCQAASEAVVA